MRTRIGSRRSFRRRLAKRRASSFRSVLAVEALEKRLVLSGPTYWSGTISADTVWDVANAPHILAGDLTVAPGVTLTIESLVEVQFNNYNYELYVDGRVDATNVDFTGSYVEIVSRSGGDVDIAGSTFASGQVRYEAGSSGTISAECATRSPLTGHRSSRRTRRSITWSQTFVGCWSRIVGSWTFSGPPSRAVR